jgi:hypothetical protein
MENGVSKVVLQMQRCLAIVVGIWLLQQSLNSFHAIVPYTVHIRIYRALVQWRAYIPLHS